MYICIYTHRESMHTYAYLEISIPDKEISEYVQYQSLKSLPLELFAASNHIRVREIFGTIYKRNTYINTSYNVMHFARLWICYLAIVIPAGATTLRDSCVVLVTGPQWCIKSKQTGYLSEIYLLCFMRISIGSALFTKQLGYLRSAFCHFY